MQSAIGKILFSVVVLGYLLAGLSNIEAQEQRRYMYDSTMPPGEIGQLQLWRRDAMRNHTQAVRLVGPEGSQVHVYNDSDFQPLGSDKAIVGMQVGQVYRVKVTNIPGYPGFEVFPSVEIINRLYPPAGMEMKFPIEVHLPIEDLVPALNGAVVTRVIYLEDPDEAVPAAQKRDDQPYFDVAVDQDPLSTAQQIGRPMAIVRAGSRIPDQNTDLYLFSFGSPPVQIFQQPAQYTPVTGSLQIEPSRGVMTSLGDN